MSAGPAPLPSEPRKLQRLLPPTGVELHGAVGGQGEPLVVVHGVMGDWLSWAPQWPAFTTRYRCHTYSRRHNYPNRNEQPSPDHSALLEAQDLLQLLDAWGFERPHIVAGSYGAFTALALALQHPQRAHGLVAVEPVMLCDAEFSERGREVLAEFRRKVVEPANAVFRSGGQQTPAIHAEVFRNVCAAMPQARVARIEGAGHGVRWVRNRS